MRQIQTEVLVIGGGATGTGIVRDLAMRGFKTILVEQRDLNHGTTGRYHGLLHSGARYVVKDPKAAKECIDENRILRRIMPQCIEDTGGFFVLTPWDDPGYVPKFLDGCNKAGIPVEELSIPQMLREEPQLNPKISRCFRVPDASADSFLASELNAESARSYGATILTYCKVTKLLRERDRINGVLCQDLIKDEDTKIFADMVINATGAWVGKIAQTAGIHINILPGKGTMVAVNHRITNTVINRCKMPSDGDILVPIHTICIIGTTDIQVKDPDHLAIEPWEILLMMDEGEKLIPGFKKARVLRCWTGVRPLYQQKDSAASRDISRSYVLLDHELLDGVADFITITSGKWTTYRLMAQATVDLVCKKLHVDRPCRTHLETLPNSQQKRYHTLGTPLREIEEEEKFGELICECELATRDDIIRSIVANGANTIDDVRRDVRLGMGPCQGSFCTYRAAGLIHQLKHPPVEETNTAIRDFLQERWRGLVPTLWGQQLRQERLKELIYVNLLGVDHLPGLRYSKLVIEPYLRTQEDSATSITEDARQTEKSPQLNILKRRLFSSTSPEKKDADVIIIGAGLSGLAAAWQLSNRGAKVEVLTKGFGTTHWHTGCIDVLGYYPITNPTPLESPREALVRLIQENATHPYAYLGEKAIEECIVEFLNLCAENNYPFSGSLDSNFLLPTAAGAIRPTCLAPMTMISGDLRSKEPMLIVGFANYLDFYPDLIADNLSAQGFPAKGVILNPSFLKSRLSVNAIQLAQCFEKEDFCAEIIHSLRPKVGSVTRIGFPAVLGIRNSSKVISHLENELSVKVFEIPTLPPSIPGIRLHNLFTRTIEKYGGRIFTGIEVFYAENNKKSIRRIWSKTAARERDYNATQYILATGGILGGGIFCDFRRDVQETAFSNNIPITLPKRDSDWFKPEFLDANGHPIFSSGIRVNQELHPIDENGYLIYENVFVVGSALGNCDVVRERSMEGIALSTGYKVGKEVTLP